MKNVWQSTGTHTGMLPCIMFPQQRELQKGTKDKIMKTFFCSGQENPMLCNTSLLLSSLPFLLLQAMLSLKIILCITAVLTSAAGVFIFSPLACSGSCVLSSMFARNARCLCVLHFCKPFLYGPSTSHC